MGETQIQAKLIEYTHKRHKREAEWKAFGFDASVLNISDPWASNNMWYQQLTHSVRTTSNNGCPCIVRIPFPSSWPSIVETIPDPLDADCQYKAITWLYIHQRKDKTNT